MKWNLIRVLIEKDIRSTMKSKYVALSVNLMPVFLSLMMLASALPIVFAPDSTDPSEVEFLSSLGFDTAGYSVEQLLALFILKSYAIVIFLVPTIIISVYGADSFAGEKERKTIEGLLITPLNDTEIYVAKLFSSIIPALIGTIVSILVFAVGSAIGTFYAYGRVIYPDIEYWLFTILIVPNILLASSNVMIWVSTKVSTSRDAQQVGGGILSIVFLLLNSLIIYASLVLNVWGLLLGFGVLVVANYLLLQIGLNIMDRDYLLSNF